jgi:hypothetical protein
MPPGFRNALRHLAAIIPWLIPLHAAAQVSVSLPFEGHYHPGRFMPVRIIAPAHQPTIELTAHGALPLVFENPKEGEAIIPFLPVSDSIKSFQVVGAQSVALVPVRDNQRVVAFVDSDPDIANTLYPGDQILPITLDLNHPFLDPPLAWTGLDAVALSPAALAHLTDSQISTLLAAGVVLIVRDPNVPDARWPWQRLANAWVLRHHIAGPQDPLRPEAYTPTYSWDHGLPAASRGQIVLMAAVFSILALGISLWRSRVAVYCFVAFCALAVSMIWLTYLRHPPQLMMQKTVAIRDNRLTQSDDWEWRACLRDSHFVQPISKTTMPIFASIHQLEQSKIRLICNSQGQPVSYEFSLAPNQSLAFVTRSVLSTPGLPSFAAVDLAWKDFVDDLYIMPGDELSGEAKIANGISATFITRPDGSRN